MLGKVLDSSCSSSKLPSSQLLAKFTASISQLDTRPIRGEYKVWIYRHPSLHFFFAIDDISKFALNKMEALATKMLKKWLHLPRNDTKAILYHPSVHIKATLGYLVAIETSKDNTITELLPLLDTKKLQHKLGFPSECFDILEAGSNSVSSIPSLKKHCRKSVDALRSSHWDSHLQSLSVQNKFSDVVSLESEPKVYDLLEEDHKLWFPLGQLSFLVNAASDTLPTPLNLKRMKIQCSSKCHLCLNPRPTTANILNGCQTALQQGRFTWRHDSVLKSITSSLTQRVCVSDNIKLYLGHPYETGTV